MGALSRRRGGNLAQLPSRGDASVSEQCFDGTGLLEPFAPLEERELDHEQEDADLAPLLLHQLPRAPGRAAGSAGRTRSAGASSVPLPYSSAYSIRSVL